jgi:hypothetical protein
LIGATGLGAGNYAIAFSPEGLLYGITRTKNFIRIDTTTTGAGSLIGQIRFAGMSALALRADAVRVNVEEDQQSPFPTTYQLEQNYPNPFNPATRIRYSLPQFSKVKLEIFDMLGRSVAVLVNESKPAGVHQARFEAREVVAGIYFYRLQAGAFVATRKMVLIR